MIEVTHFTDPSCPFAFSAEPTRLRLAWHYGDGLRWTHRMIGLTREPGHAEALAEGADGLRRRYGMPIAPGSYERAADGEPACRAVVAARLHAPEAEDALLRALRVRRMAGGLIDDPSLLAAAARDAGLDPDEHAARAAGDDVTDALEADVATAHDPSPAARALDHKLGGKPERRRYSAPSYELSGPGGRFSVPGFTAVEAYEAAIASLDPDLPRRPAPGVDELLAWAPYPLATVEVVTITGGDEGEVRAELAATARCLPSGSDAYWTAV